MRNINLKTVKTPQELIEQFNNLNIEGHALTKKDLVDLQKIKNAYVNHISAAYVKTGTMEDKDFVFNYEKENVNEYVVEYFEKFKESLKEITAVRLKRSTGKIEVSDELAKYDKNDNTLLYYPDKARAYLTRSPLDIFKYSSLAHNYIKHLILKDESIEFPIEYFKEKLSIDSDGVIEYFESQKEYLREITLPKIKKSSPAILLLIADWIFDIILEVPMDEYGNK